MKGREKKGRRGRGRERDWERGQSETERARFVPDEQDVLRSLDSWCVGVRVHPGFRQLETAAADEDPLSCMARGLRAIRV